MGGNNTLQITNWGSKTSRHMLVASNPHRTRILVSTKALWRGRPIKKMLRTIDMSATDTASREMILWKWVEKSQESKPTEIKWPTRQESVNQNWHLWNDRQVAKWETTAFPQTNLTVIRTISLENKPSRRTRIEGLARVVTWRTRQVRTLKISSSKWCTPSSNNSNSSSNTNSNNKCKIRWTKACWWGNTTPPVQLHPDPIIKSKSNSLTKQRTQARMPRFYPKTLQRSMKSFFSSRTCPSTTKSTSATLVWTTLSRYPPSNRIISRDSWSTSTMFPAQESSPSKQDKSCPREAPLISTWPKDSARTRKWPL